MIPGSASPLLLSSAGAYNLTKSLRFRKSASASLTRTPTAVGNTKTFTFSTWLKRGQISSDHSFFTSGNAAPNPRASFEFITATDALYISFNNGSGWVALTTSAVYRDPSAWYHIVVAVDTTQATSTNRVKLYVNGSQVTAFSSATYPNQNDDTSFNTTVPQALGYYIPSPSQYFDGYMAEINMVDGQQLTASSFGQTSTTTGVWVPKKYSGSYGTNGFYLPFTNTTSTATLGNDFSGNNNTWTVNNISLTAGTTYDSMTDVPTLTNATTANYAVINPLKVSSNAATISSANLNVLFTLGSGQQTRRQGTIGVSTGKYYFEVLVNAVGGTYPAIGVMFSSTSDMNNYVGAEAGTFGYYSLGGVNGGGGGRTYSSYTANDVIGVAMDLTNSQLTFYKNGANAVTSGTTYESLTAGAEYVPAVSGFSNASFSINFGQQPFSYTPPTGFVALNTFNLPTPTIGATAATTANEYFDVSLWTGNGTSQTIVNSGSMPPDFVWTKQRSGTANNCLLDSVRGVSRVLFSDLTNAEFNDPGYYVTAFNSNGFSVGLGSGSNGNGSSYVGWQWRANGTAVTNTSGSISSQVSANTTAGFSIVTYTGNGANSTIGHGLGVAPSMMIVKDRSSSSWNWVVYHSAIGNTQILELNTTNAAVTYSQGWNNTSPTSTVFSIGTGAGVNANADTYVAYCFAQVAGYSAFGSYTGNGSSDGPFVFTGFRPRWIMVKPTNVSGEYWQIIDTSRNPYNASPANMLSANLSDAEAAIASQTTDILSNGFKFRGTGGGTNGSGTTYIYMAFAESPFKYANAR
jgi:hypothetical protein